SRVTNLHVNPERIDVRDTLSDIAGLARRIRRVLSDVCILREAPVIDDPVFGGASAAALAREYRGPVLFLLVRHERPAPFRFHHVRVCVDDGHLQASCWPPRKWSSVVLFPAALRWRAPQASALF